MSLSDIFNFKNALVRNGIPNSVKNGLSIDENHEEVNVENARIQHRNYLDCLRNSGLTLHEIEPDEIYPDCVFVEDTAVVIGKKVLITNPGAPSRRGEAEATGKLFQKIKDKYDLDVYVMNPNGEATVDGGDCCFTGRELLVGLSRRTNQKGFYFNLTS